MTVLDFSPFLQDIYNMIYILSVEPKKFPRNISQYNALPRHTYDFLFKINGRINDTEGTWMRTVL